MESEKKFLNLGCGNRYFQEWTNIDFVGNPKENVIQHDLTLGLPFKDQTFDFIYNSHVLEHFAKKNGEKFISEIYRVLKEGGQLRIVIPDLEQIAKKYIECLEKLDKEKNKLNQANHEWITMELLDQMVRTYSGGEIGRLWSNPKIINESFIKERVGYEFDNYRHWLLNTKTINHTKNKRSLIRNLKLKFASFLLNEPRLSELLKISKFKTSGENHLWMYDRLSISKLLDEAGFKNITVQDAFSSNFPEWNIYSWLDVENNEIRKPDSIFIEAVKL